MKRAITPVQPRFRRLPVLGAIAILLAVTLAACGGGGGSDPTPTILPTESAQQPIATPRPGEVTVGMLADRIAAAWPSVTTIRQIYATSFDTATPTASPTATDQYTVTTEVDATGDKQITITAMQLIITQLVIIRGQIWVWGFYEALNIPAEAVGEPFGDGWMSVDTSAAAGNATFNQLVLSLLSPYPVVYSTFSDAQRARVVEPLGEIAVGDRTCTAYRIPETTQTGQAYDTITSLDESGLPCSIDTSAFGQTQVNTYVFNESFDIVPPSTTPSTPSASPVAGS